MKIAIGEVSHETNTFSAVPTTVEAFRRVQWNTGKGLMSAHTDVRDYLGGMIDQARESGADLIPTFAASAYPSGTITVDAFENLIATLRKTVTENAWNADAFCLSLHGAGVADGIDDLEYEVLKAVRNIVGGSTPAVATLDLHANLTAATIHEADALA